MITTMIEIKLGGGLESLWGATLDWEVRVSGLD